MHRVNDVRVELYRSFIEDQRSPERVAIADRLQLPVAEVTDALRRLEEEGVIAFVPGSEDIWLVHPFCATPAPFQVTIEDRSWGSICIWDALGILALLESDGSVLAACPDCRRPIDLKVSDGEVVAPPDALVHFGVPARRWYEDIGFT